MLPRSYFERLSAAYGLRTYSAPRERRSGIRIDLRARCHVHELLPKAGIGMTVGAPTPIRLREISTTGGSFLCPEKMRPGQEFLLRLESREGVCNWLWSRCRRSHSIDHLASLIGMVFIRVLYPGQDIMVGANVSSAVWLDVEGPITPEDPFVGEPAAA